MQPEGAVWTQTKFIVGALRRSGEYEAHAYTLKGQQLRTVAVFSCKQLAATFSIDLPWLDSIRFAPREFVSSGLSIVVLVCLLLACRGPDPRTRKSLEARSWIPTEPRRFGRRAPLGLLMRLYASASCSWWGLLFVHSFACSSVRTSETRRAFKANGPKSMAPKSPPQNNGQGGATHKQTATTTRSKAQHDFGVCQFLLCCASRELLVGRPRRDQSASRKEETLRGAAAQPANTNDNNRSRTRARWPVKHQVRAGGRLSLATGDEQ